MNTFQSFKKSWLSLLRLRALRASAVAFPLPEIRTSQG
jgi:hypothetical protein